MEFFFQRNQLRKNANLTNCMYVLQLNYSALPFSSGQRPGTLLVVKNRCSLASKFMPFLLRKVPWEKPPPYEVNKKVQKRTFPAIFSKKVTSKTHLNIGFYLYIVESFGKNGYFLLNKLVEAADFCMFQYITLLHKL